jgi:hypothetical protein
MREPFITTFTGRKVNPLALRIEDIDIRDIAHHLACINRFCGALREPVSVAQHSVYVSRLLDGSTFELIGLLHDASEAYLGDVTKWLKQSPEMRAFREAEDRAQAVIYEAFGCDLYLAQESLDWADRLMVRYEAWVGLPKRGQHLFEMGDPSYAPPSPEDRDAIGRFVPWTWRQSEEAFLTRYREIRNGFTSVPAFRPLAEARRNEPDPTQG